jgi:predicted transcriptional regulator
MRAAFLGGLGRTAEEIEADTGISARRVRELLAGAGLSLVREHQQVDVMAVRWKRHDTDRLNAAAHKLDLDPSDLAARIIRGVIERDGLVEKLVDPLDVIG